MSAIPPISPSSGGVPPSLPGGKPTSTSTSFLGPSLTVDNGLNLSLLSVLGGLIAVQSNANNLNVTQIYNGAVADIQNLNAQIQASAQKVTYDQQQIASLQAQIAALDPNSPTYAADKAALEAQITGYQSDITTQENLMTSLSLLASSVGVLRRILTIGQNQVPAQPLVDTELGRNQKRTLPVATETLLKNFLEQLEKITEQSGSDPQISSLRESLLREILLLTDSSKVSPSQYRPPAA